MLNEKEFLRLISDSIRKRRLAGKISSEKLSELSGMDYSSINLIENQKQNPRSYPNTLSEIANVWADFYNRFHSLIFSNFSCNNCSYDFCELR